MSDVLGFIPEARAREICAAAIREERCSEMLECLFDGGSASVNSETGRLVLASAEQLRSLHPNWLDDD